MNEQLDKLISDEKEKRVVKMARTRSYQKSIGILIIVFSILGSLFLINEIWGGSVDNKIYLTAISILLITAIPVMVYMSLKRNIKTKTGVYIAILLGAVFIATGVSIVMKYF